MSMRLILAAALSAAMLPVLAQADDLPAIRERGKLIAVTTANLPPNTYVDENNELVDARANRTDPPGSPGPDLW